jgi:hypothetical protein
MVMVAVVNSETPHPHEDLHLFGAFRNIPKALEKPQTV